MSSTSPCSFLSLMLPAWGPPFLRPSRLARSEPSRTPRPHFVPRIVSSSLNPKRLASTRIFTLYIASSISHLENRTLQRRKSEVFYPHSVVSPLLQEESHETRDPAR